jgi:hypothetical protein
MAKIAQPIAEELAPVHVPSLPDGVQQGPGPHYVRAKEFPPVRDPKKPPPGWLGSYETCGWCGDFIRAVSCPTCAPSAEIMIIVDEVLGRKR